MTKPKRQNSYKIRTAEAHKHLQDALKHFNKVAMALEEAEGIMEAVRHIDRGRPRKCYCGTCPKCKASARAKRYRESIKKKAAVQI